jgi:hypothetical protein
LQAAQKVGLDRDIYNRSLIRITHKFRITYFIRIQGTAKYQISQLPAAQEVELGLDTNK